MFNRNKNKNTINPLDRVHREVEYLRRVIYDLQNDVSLLKSPYKFNLGDKVLIASDAFIKIGISNGTVIQRKLYQNPPCKSYTVACKDNLTVDLTEDELVKKLF